MMMRHALLLVLCGVCLAAAPSLPAPAAPATGDTTEFDSSHGTINLDQPAAKAAPERAQIGNPLWAIPLGSLAVTRDRPLFTPSRRPPAPAVVAVPVIAPPKIALPPPEPEHSSLTLIGTVVGDNEGIGVFLDQATHDVVRMKTGEGHAGWILRLVKAREVTLEKGSKSETLRLPARSDSNAPAPAGPRPGDPL